ncbi:non-ribosomal peptide synthetase [Flavobacterium humi]|uniref:Amino acid adenylation domain-containing protein n=1 Tax=Flavobacterium humi TaxID=2562683 RepID=A0A4Z0L898_9FLAO|nr:non-ribosomal peptide synthetase [Flavobacterium humi]TGD58753.1 amino acid adenylation domain-containing protein [Flavobacterium humi]
MEKEISLKKARIEEFWHAFLSENPNSNSASFFGGTHLKNENTVTKRKIFLSTEDVKKAEGLCNGSDVLLYNFYCSALSILVSKYEENFSFLSPVNQFEGSRESKGLFVLKPLVESTQSFKEIFSSQKETLLKSIEYAFDLGTFEDSFLDFESFQKNEPFGLLVNSTNEEVPAIVKTVFDFDLKNESPYLEISIKGEMYDAGLLEVFGENFNVLFHEVLQNTYGAIATLAFRGSRENHILEEINQPKNDFPLDKNILELLQEQCARQKDKIAIVNGSKTITYTELDAQTNQLGRYIQDSFQTGKDMLFGMMLSRSVNMVKGILSVWKAGSAYVPMATNLSDEALLHIIENSNLKAVITDSTEVLEQLSRLSHNVAVIDLSTLLPMLGALSDTPVPVTVSSKDLAYVIYTSGSTGKPKGAMIEHFGMLNHIGAKIQEMGIHNNSIVAQNAPHTFDISVWQFFAPLVAGGTSVIYDDEVVLNVNQLVHKMAEDKITLLELVPSYLLEMLHELENEDNTIPLALDIIILNAETLTKAMVKRWLDLYPAVPIVNTYGATEVSDDISHYVMTEVPEYHSVPVMKAIIQNVEIHIVDEHKNRVPLGVKGEILLAGPCVGRGYFNDGKRTDEAFLKGPMEGITSLERIYKTGDSGRFLSDGTLEFLGRNDNQVKILGYRIELDAIENIASGLPQVKNAKAIAYTDQQIIALYYVADTEIDTAIFEEELLKALPSYMLPSAYVHMNSFPVTANGKIDKKRLPEITDKDLVKSEYTPPSNEIEEKLVTIWKEILNKEKIGIHDDFFALGGNSLMAMRVFNKVSNEFGIKVDFKSFFNKPTIGSLGLEILFLTEQESIKEENLFELDI